MRSDRKACDPFAFATERALDGVELYVQRLQRDGRAGGDAEPATSEPADYPRDAELKRVTRDRRDAERRLRELRRREAELIRRARERGER